MLTTVFVSCVLVPLVAAHTWRNGGIPGNGTASNATSSIAASVSSQAVVVASQTSGYSRTQATPMSSPRLLTTTFATVAKSSAAAATDSSISESTDGGTLYISWAEVSGAAANEPSTLLLASGTPHVSIEEGAGVLQTAAAGTLSTSSVSALVTAPAAAAPTPTPTPSRFVITSAAWSSRLRVHPLGGALSAVLVLLFSVI